MAIRIIADHWRTKQFRLVAIPALPPSGETAMLRCTDVPAETAKLIDSPGTGRYCSDGPGCAGAVAGSIAQDARHRVPRQNGVVDRMGFPLWLLPAFVTRRRRR